MLLHRKNRNAQSTTLDADLTTVQSILKFRAIAYQLAKVTMKPIFKPALVRVATVPARNQVVYHPNRVRTRNICLHAKSQFS